MVATFRSSSRAGGSPSAVCSPPAGWQEDDLFVVVCQFDSSGGVQLASLPDNFQSLVAAWDEGSGGGQIVWKAAGSTQGNVTFTATPSDDIEVEWLAFSGADVSVAPEVNTPYLNASTHTYSFNSITPDQADSLVAAILEIDGSSGESITSWTGWGTGFTQRVAKGSGSQRDMFLGVADKTQGTSAVTPGPVTTNQTTAEAGGAVCISIKPAGSSPTAGPIWIDRLD